MESLESAKILTDIPAWWTWNVNKGGNPEDLGGRHPTKQPYDEVPIKRKASTSKMDMHCLEEIPDDLPV